MQVAKRLLRLAVVAWENDLLAALPLEDRLRLAAVDLALTGAPRALAAACWRAAEVVESRHSTNGPGAQLEVVSRLRLSWLLALVTDGEDGGPQVLSPCACTPIARRVRHVD